MKIYNERQNEAALKRIEHDFYSESVDQLIRAVANYEAWQYPIGINVVQRAYYWLRWLLS